MNTTALALAGVETFRNRIIHTDALTLINSLPDHSINHIITDAPYGLAANPPLKITRLTRARNKVRGNGGAYSRVTEAWDHYVPLDWMEVAQRKLKRGGSVVIFSGKLGLIEIGSMALSLGWKLVNEVVWKKPDAPPNFSGRMLSECTEKFYWFCPDGTGWTYNRHYARQMNNGRNFRDVWEFLSPRENRVHPTQKPLELMDRIVRLLTNPGDIILDLFCGSGTTLVAANNAGRSYIGCDLDETSVEAARTRLLKVSDLPLFLTAPKVEQPRLFANLPTA